MLDVTGQAVAVLYASIPDTVTVDQAMALPWGPARNLALRKALDIPLGSPEVCMVSQADVVQVVTDKPVSRRVAGTLIRGLPEHWQVLVTRRPDGQWLITAHGDG